MQSVDLSDCQETHLKVINYVSLCEDYPSEEEQNMHQEDGKSKPL